MADHSGPTPENLTTANLDMKLPSSLSPTIPERKTSKGGIIEPTLTPAHVYGRHQYQLVYLKTRLRHKDNVTTHQAANT
jgi:hypothetical protein